MTMMASHRDGEMVYIIYMLVIMSASAPIISAVSLTGVDNSYAAYDNWKICSSSKLTFEFKSYQEDGLLVYQNQVSEGDMGAFLEIKLVFGQLRMRLKFTKESVVSFTIGENLNDRQWHKVTVDRSGDVTILILDKNYSKTSLTIKSSNNNRQYPSHNRRSSHLYFGGLPSLDVLRLHELASPSTFYESRFSGIVSNISYVNCTGQPVEPNLQGVHGERHNETDLCHIYDPCMNSGRCLNLGANVTMCDCEKTIYSGPLCDAERSQKTATFSGFDYLHYNFTGHGEAITSDRESIKISFKTSSGDGLLFYTGDERSYLNVGLHDGVIYLAMDMGDGEEVDTIGSGRQFDDDQWHDIIIERETTQMTRTRGVCTVFVSVDYGSFETSRSFAGQFINLKSKILYLGGAYRLMLLPGTKATQNFHGCLKGVRFTADGVHLDLLNLAQSGAGILSQFGNLLYDTCQQVLQVEPVSILRPEDVIILPRLGKRNTNFISLTFTTVESEGLLIYSSDTDSDTFALEIYSGYIYIILDLSGSVARQRIGDQKVNNGHQQNITISFINSGAAVMLNTVPQTVSVGGANSNSFRFTGVFSLAGINKSKQEMRIHPAVYTAALNRGYVGCLHNVKIDGQPQNLKLMARQQGLEVGQHCNQTTTDQCLANTCMHGGTCQTGWNRHICNCQLTTYYGSSCNRESMIMRFDGKQHLTITPRTRISTITDQLTVQFRTKLSHGAVVNTRSKDRQSGLDIFMYMGKLYIRITLKATEHLLEAGEGLNDYQWHSLTVLRAERNVKVIVNSDRVIDTELPSPVRDGEIMDYIINIDEIKLGQPIDEPIGRMVRDSRPESISAFTGHIRQFVFNNIHYIDLAYAGQTGEITYSAEFTDLPNIPANQVSIGSSDTFIALRLQRTNRLRSVYVQVKTSEPSGLILYRGGRNGDYFALELIQGAVSYVYNVGDKRGNIRTQKHNYINDNKWHDIVIMRLSGGEHYLIVDNIKYATAQDEVENDFHLDSELYVAGVPQDMYMGLPSSINSPYGFSGCMASLDVNGLQPDLVVEGRGDKRKLANGCFDSELCSADSCKNGGVCIQTWPSVSCQCEMTSFTGSQCSDDGTTYHFGSQSGGLIMYTFPSPRPDTTEDRLAFGLITKQSDCLILKLHSNNSQDLLKIFLKGGRLVILFNIGTLNHTISDSSAPVNDGSYHVIRYIRLGSNASLQIDDESTVYTHPKVTTVSPRIQRDGERLTVFNSMSQLAIGGELSKSGEIHQPFHGLLSGLWFNNKRILGLAKANDESITIHGDARLTDLNKSDAGMQNSQPDEPPVTVTDELIIPVGTPCVSHGNTHLCNQRTDDGGIIRKILTTHNTPRRTTLVPVKWPDNRGRTNKPAVSWRTRTDTSTKTMISGTVSHKPGVHYPAEQDTTTHGPFDLKKNIPLIAGICGAALVTVILIAVIICRLSRKEDEKYAVVHRPSASIDEDLRNDVNGRRRGSPPSHTTSTVVSDQPNRRSDGKEWYV